MVIIAIIIKLIILFLLYKVVKIIYVKFLKRPYENMIKKQELELEKKRLEIENLKNKE